MQVTVDEETNATGETATEARFMEKCLPDAQIWSFLTVGVIKPSSEEHGWEEP